MKMDKSKPVMRWAIVSEEDGNRVTFQEVEDVMRCIEGPGDYGWVEPVNGDGRWIADFEQLSESREGAKETWIATLKARIDKAQRQLAQAEAL